ncbi:acid phosphatase AphA [Teratosphaeria destructans]|uniref:Purple acid phosphatase n=1 Tax=Teratosphaeria destructans TaxID=418781 RepID=A0A9W7SV10_9PEZI|nr:acid phosphatase AphA [Teratosphaeria destructans]
MVARTVAALVGAVVLASAAPTQERRDVDTMYPYTGPQVPVGDWVDATVNGNGKGFIRLVEGPAVTPETQGTPKNSINVISLAYIPGGMTVHYQTPFGLGADPVIRWGLSSETLNHTTSGYTTHYDRTPSCSQAMTTMCSAYFHNVLLPNLQSGTTYYYMIPVQNGTTASPVHSFTTARAAGDNHEFSIAVLNDMGYTNAQGTYQYLNQAADEVAFAWHGGDISYADDWFDGILSCDSEDVCYNGSDSTLTNTPPAPFPEDYNMPLPEGEIPDQGSPRGGDENVIYETNWDIWQQWMNPISMKIPYMTLPGNHEAACTEFDGAGNILTAYLNSNISNGTAPKDGLTYYSCPPSQRPGNETNGVGNFWYSFDYGNAHFVSFDGETDYPYSPEWPFVRDLTGNETHPLENQTFPTDSGPFGSINGSWRDPAAYQQIRWLADDLARVDRTKTPWVFAMTHRPLYSSEVAAYETHMRHAFEQILLRHRVDAYFASHIHWYERLWPLNNLSIVASDIVDDHTYHTGTGESVTYLVNGMAGNIESHSSLDASEILDYTAVLNQYDFGFSKLTIHNGRFDVFKKRKKKASWPGIFPHADRAPIATDTVATWKYIMGVNGSVGDTLTMIHSPQESAVATSSVPGVSASATTTTAHGASSTGPDAPIGT